MSRTFRWIATLATVVLFASTGCSLTHNRSTPFENLSGRDPQVTSPAQFAGPAPPPATPQGGYQAHLVSAPRSAPAPSRSGKPQCFSFG